jgi:hypothetical protein
MHSQSTLWFVLSLALLLCSHMLRATRQATLYPRKYGVRRLDLLLGLAMSYAVNTVVPYRIGELVRILYVARRCRIRASYVAATVVAERVADLVFVGLVALCLLGAHALPPTVLAPTAAMFLAVAITALAAAFAIKRSARFRRGLWHFAAIFSNSNRDGLLDLFWSYSEIVTGGLIGRRRFLLLTPFMWAGYTLSYLCFSRASGLGLRAVMMALLGSPLRSTASSLGFVGVTLEDRTLFYMLVPVYVILIFGLLRERTRVFRALNAIAAGGPAGSLLYATPIRDRFKQPAEYEAFLVSNFSQRSHILTDFSLIAMADGAVQRLLPGGSDAVTALVECEDKLIIRKFAMGAAAAKLEVQAEWLRRYREQLPLVEIAAQARTSSGFYSYDMPYLPTARDFYDVIHTSNHQHSDGVLRAVIEAMLNFHDATKSAPADCATIRRYLSEKAAANTRFALQQTKGWFSDVGSRYLLNGEEYDLKDWQRFLDVEWMSRQIGLLDTAVIHGDLTIENIIVSAEQPGGFFLIDPNPDNIFNSPLIDWAKLMQSLHLGYEGLNKAPVCTWKDGALSLILSRSHAYTELHESCRKQLVSSLGGAAQREIAFHEIVNYLRLVPYKFRQSPTKGLVFFACTSILMRDYIEAYG